MKETLVHVSEEKVIFVKNNRIPIEVIRTPVRLDVDQVEVPGTVSVCS